MRAVDVAGSNTSIPNRPAPAYAAASRRFFTTDWVRVGGARLSDTVVPDALALRARHRWRRFARA